MKLVSVQRDLFFLYSLYNNQITDTGAKYVARLIEECPSLTYVK